MELTRGVKGKILFMANLFVSCKETFCREIPTGEETKNVELSKNDDLIISPFLFRFCFCFVFCFCFCFCFLFFLFSRIHGNYGLN